MAVVPSGTGPLYDLLIEVFILRWNLICNALGCVMLQHHISKAGLGYTEALYDDPK